MIRKWTRGLQAVLARWCRNCSVSFFFNSKSSFSSTVHLSGGQSSGYGPSIASHLRRRCCIPRYETYLGGATVIPPRLAGWHVPRKSMSETYVGASDYRCKSTLSTPATVRVKIRCKLSCRNSAESRDAKSFSPFVRSAPPPRRRLLFFQLAPFVRRPTKKQKEPATAPPFAAEAGRENWKASRLSHARSYATPELPFLFLPPRFPRRRNGSVVSTAASVFREKLHLSSLADCISRGHKNSTNTAGINTETTE